MHLSEWDANDGDAEYETVEDVGEPYPDAANEEPQHIHEDAQTAKAVLKACYDGGVRAFEFTNRGDFAHEVFGELVKFADKELPGMIMGIGSIVDPATAALYLQLGANLWSQGV